jgi:hypothetical protein
VSVGETATTLLISQFSTMPGCQLRALPPD